jgi:hypothetical protein
MATITLNRDDRYDITGMVVDPSPAWDRNGVFFRGHEYFFAGGHVPAT